MRKGRETFKECYRKPLFVTFFTHRKSIRVADRFGQKRGQDRVSLVFVTYSPIVAASDPGNVFTSKQKDGEMG